MLLYFDPSVFELLYFLSGAVFAEEYWVLIVRPIIVSRLEKPVTSTFLAAKSTRNIVFNFPEWISHPCLENNPVHPKENACPDEISQCRRNPKIGALVLAEHTDC